MKTEHQSKIYPVILCGGSGTRLWPLSRKSYPKQFTALFGDQSLFQASVKRTFGPDYARPLIVTNPDFRFTVAQQLAEIQVDPGAIILEPEGRNTAPAILTAALHLHREDPDAVMLVAPSDHLIPDNDAFQAAVQRGLQAIADHRLVTFGIVPTHAHKGYGYLELAHTPAADDPWTPLQAFVEKPEQHVAETLVQTDRHLWNAGIFLFHVKDILAAFEEHSGALVAPVRAAVDNALPDLGFLRLDPDSWDAVADISIDYAVMEHADNLAVVPFDGGWSDLGGWDAVWDEGTPDADGVVQHGATTAIDCRDTMLRSESASVQVVGIGLDNIFAVALQDAVLVADKSRSQDVKQAVAKMKAQNVPQATQFPKDHRPWGWFESLAVGGRFQVKHIHVHPGGILSLQSHFHRAEHWIVVEGTAKVTIGETEQLLTENQSVYIPLGAVHRLENPGKFPVVLIEVQTGSYIGEDDITRYEDIYARSSDADV